VFSLTHHNEYWTQPMKLSAAVWRGFILVFLEARIVGRDTLTQYPL
jgi:hypothetical protein